MNRIPPIAIARIPSPHLCPIEWAPDIDVALATLADFVADVAGGNLAFDAYAVEAVRWAVNVLWFSAAQCDGAALPELQRGLAAARVDVRHAAALMLPFVDEMKPQIEKRIAVAADMLARYC